MGRKSLEEITRGVARMETSHSDSSRLIIGIDFGTTYSGVAYYFTGMRDQKVYAVSNWPGKPFMPATYICISPTSTL